MKTSGTCPACQGRLSLWAGMTAPTPFYIRCPACRAKLRVRMRGLWLFFLGLVVVMAGTAAAWLAAYRTFGWRGFWVGFVCCGIVWLLVEVVAAVTLYTNAEFDIAESGRTSHQETSDPRD